MSTDAERIKDLFNTDEIALPHYEAIIVKCVHEMGIKFKNYGNDWLKSDDLYWKKRILNEVDEYVKSMTPDSEKRKLLNIINMCAMAFETADTNRGCRNHKIPFDVLMRSENVTLLDNCTICKKMVFIRDAMIYEEENNVRE